MKYTGERYLPEVKGPETSCEHWHRYLYASQFAGGKAVLDIACGEGYGAYLLSESARLVVGIDNSEETIRYAASKYVKKNLKFMLGDAGEIPIEGSALFDLVVCFETIEHLQAGVQVKFMREVKRLLKPSGLFIVSTPNKLAYSDIPEYHNEFHLREFYVPEFQEFLSVYFAHIDMLGQRIYPVSYIWPPAGAQGRWSEYRLLHSDSGFRPTSDAKEIMYVVAICSDRPLQASKYSVALDLSSQMLRIRDQEIEAARRVAGEREEAIHSLQSEANRLTEQLDSFRSEKDHLAAQLESLQSEKDHLAAQLESLQSEKDHLAAQLEPLQSEKDHVAAQLESLQSEKDHLAAQLESLRSERDQVEEQLRSSQMELDQRLQGIRELHQERDRLASDLQQILGTYKWKAALLMGRARHWVAPEGTRRGKAYWLMMRGVEVWRSEGLAAALRKALRKLRRGREGHVKRQHGSFWVAGRRGRPGSTPGTRERGGGTTPSLLVHAPGQTTNSLLMRPKHSLSATVSVVIPTKDAVSEGFENLLQALRDQKGVASPEILVVDSGSTDATVQVAREYSARVIEIQPEEFNHGATRNLAAQNSQGEVILFMTQDAIPASEDLLHELAGTLLADDVLAGVSPRQIPKSNADIYACWEVVNHYRYISQAPRARPGHPADLAGIRSDELRRLATLDNVCAMVRRNVWDQVRFRPMGFAEDLQFGVDCLGLGYRTALISHRAVIHSHTRSPSYILAKHYVDKLVLSKILSEVPQPWIDSLDLGQLVTALRGLHWTVAELSRNLSEAETYDPCDALRSLSDRAPYHPSLTKPTTASSGDSALDSLMDEAGDLFVGDYPLHDPCVGAFRGKLDVISSFLEGRYPAVDGFELSSIILKAFSGTAGMLLGEYCYGRSLRGLAVQEAPQLDALLLPFLRLRI
jgi:ubiquinone/menaquinone biosynthesis C-methylase UbiE/GT2 family glycosyltransferase/archaellum component FlaC